MKADTVDQFYNVGTGIRTTIKALAEMILELTHSDQSIQYEPSGTTFVKNRIGCPKKSSCEIDFNASTHLRQGLQQLIQWRNSHLNQVKERRDKVTDAV